MLVLFFSLSSLLLPQLPSKSYFTDDTPRAFLEDVREISPDADVAYDGDDCCAGVSAEIDFVGFVVGLPAFFLSPNIPLSRKLLAQIRPRSPPL